MLNLSRLLGAAPASGPDLRYDRGIRHTRVGALPGQGPVVVWNWTQSCNLRCEHCYASAVLGRVPGELDTAEAEAVLHTLTKMRVPALLLSGGEPLARPDALHLLGVARQAGLRCTLSTNGTLIDERAAGALAEVGVTYVGISLDGPPELHDRWRGKTGAHAASLAGIRNLRRLGVRTGLRFTLNRHNVAHIPYLLDLAEAEGIGRVCFYHLVPSGRGESVADLTLERQQSRAALDVILERTLGYVRSGRDMEILTVGNHADGPYAYLWMRRHAPEAADEAWRLLQRNGGNRSGQGMVCLGPQGDLHPDQFSWDVRLGNIRQTPLPELWAGAATHPVLIEMRGSRRERITGRCSSCAWFDVCNGNLRARARAAGDPWGSDPACQLTDAELGHAPAAVVS